MWATFPTFLCKEKGGSLHVGLGCNPSQLCSKIVYAPTWCPMERSLWNQWRCSYKTSPTQPRCCCSLMRGLEGDNCSPFACLFLQFYWSYKWGQQGQELALLLSREPLVGVFFVQILKDTDGPGSFPSQETSFLAVKFRHLAAPLLVSGVNPSYLLHYGINSPVLQFSLLSFPLNNEHRYNMVTCITRCDKISEWHLNNKQFVIAGSLLILMKVRRCVGHATPVPHAIPGACTTGANLESLELSDYLCSVFKDGTLTTELAIATRFQEMLLCFQLKAWEMQSMGIVNN